MSGRTHGCRRPLNRDRAPLRRVLVPSVQLNIEAQKLLDDLGINFFDSV